MKKIVVSMFILSIFFTACKTSKYATKSAYEPAIDNSVDDIESNSAEEEVIQPQREIPIVMKMEEVTIEKSNDQKLRAFYVIIGSFSNPENADKLQNQQLQNGVPAVVLKSETGMFRVAKLGTDNEQEARNKIKQIRTESNEFPDVWLLKTK